MESSDLLLQLNQVSRVFPRDVSQIASSVLREMFLPLSALRRCPPDHFHALCNANLALARGEKVGVLGAHRSGKSTLAGIAAGQLQPTSGIVMASGLRSLVARPGAGFRPGLSVIENLQFRTMLHGVTGEAMHAIVERTLDLCGVGRDLANKAIGNLSRFVTRQLGLTLLLELPADILIVDEVTGAGTGEARWELRGRLQDCIETTTSLVLSADAAFIRDMVNQAYVLHGGRLYGPFEVDQAVDAYERLPVEEEAEDVTDEVFDPRNPPRATGSAMVRAGGGEYELEASESDDPAGDAEPHDGRRRKSSSAPWRAVEIMVDGEKFRHASFSLIRRPGSALRVSLELIAQSDQLFTGGLFTLHGGNSGTEVGTSHYEHVPLSVAVGDKMNLSFELVVPNWGEDFYGLTFCPETPGGEFISAHRLKVLVFGVGCKHDRQPERVLEIRNSSFERKLANGNVDALPEGQQASGEMGWKVQTPA